MKRSKTEIKALVNAYSKSELAEMVIAMASRKEYYDYLSVHFFDKQEGELELYQKAIEDIDKLWIKRYKGFSEELRMANMIGACNKRVSEFAKISKNKKLEADLLMYILDDVFRLYSRSLGTCFTSFDSKVALTVRRVLTLIKKLHPDYHIEYEEKINSYLDVLHRRSDHLDSVFNMPKSI
ncbi:MAG: hypothetical protein PHT92_02655 [Bacteroidales bacterium]|jgi:hypothetical protein|nr:hypothetical protein [Bacteroidales bacterium]